MITSQQNSLQRNNTSSTLILQVIKDTILKSKPQQSETLSTQEKHNLKAGTQLSIVTYEGEGNHLKVMLSEAMFGSDATGYIFGGHIEILDAGTKIYPDPHEIKLPVPYKSQMDNNNDPTGTCNVTSIAMCLEYLKVPRQSSQGQFEDELDDYAYRQGLDRHVPDHLAQIVRDYGATDTFTATASVEEVKTWLATGNPAVIHGYFTEPGHIIVLVGYDNTGFFVHDPAGEWFRFGYDYNDPFGNNEKGKFLHYSYHLIQEKCIPDGSFWVHFISR
jgi:uncharacterized protein YvpB